VSQDNVKLAKRVIDAFNGRDADAIFECVTPDIEWFPAVPVSFGGGALRGREGIESYLRDVSDTWAEYRVLSEDFRDLGRDQVLVLSRVQGRGASSGGRIDEAMGQIFDIRDGKVSRVRTYLDHGEALKAVGLEG